MFCPYCGKRKVTPQETREGITNYICSSCGKRYALSGRIMSAQKILKIYPLNANFKLELENLVNLEKKLHNEKRAGDAYTIRLILDAINPYWRESDK